MKPIPYEVLKAILVPTPPEEDRRSFFVRLLRSLKITAKVQRSNAGKTGVTIGVRGGADF